LEISCRSLDSAALSLFTFSAFASRAYPSSLFLVNRREKLRTQGPL
jgi:hypothetical protein